MMRRRIRIGLTSWPSVASARQILCSARSACPTIEIPEATAPTRFSPTSFIRSAAMALRDADALPDGTSDKILFVRGTRRIDLNASLVFYVVIVRVQFQGLDVSFVEEVLFEFCGRRAENVTVFKATNLLRESLHVGSEGRERVSVTERRKCHGLASEKPGPPGLTL